ncbi:MAG: glycosyltransferase family 2 protein [Armatimonadota bacterium]
MIITIGIPFLNSKDTLPDAIRSVFAQSFEDWELILVDDGSSDGSIDIAYAVDDPRVRIISDGVNRGLAFRLNEIARLAQGSCLARMDADDIMHPNRLACQVEFLNANPQIDLVGTAIYTIDAANNPVGLRCMDPIATDAVSVLKGGLFMHPTVAGRAEWFLNNPYDESFLGSEDHELWFRTFRYTSFGKLRVPLLYYRENIRNPQGYLKHYLKAARYRRMAVATYGPSLIGRPQCALLLADSYLKGELYRAATMLGAQSALVRARSAVLGQDDLKTAMDGLEAISRTQVPGFAGGAESL